MRKKTVDYRRETLSDSFFLRKMRSILGHMMQMQPEIAELTGKNAGYDSSLCYDGEEPAKGNRKGEENKVTFGEKLYQMRKAHGLSQEALAEKLNTSRQAVSKWENNNGYPETEKIILIAKLFQVSLDELLMEERELGMEPGCADENRENSHAGRSEGPNGYYVNREAANGFLLYYKKKFLWIAAACGFIIGCNSQTYSSIEPGFYELAVEPVLTTLSVLALFSIVFYIILKQNPYRNFRKKELVFSGEVRRELQEEFSKMKKVLLAGIAVCLLLIAIDELYFDYWLNLNWDTMYLMNEAGNLWSILSYMIFVGVCVFVIVFCAGVYWSYAVLLRGDFLRSGE